MSARRVDAVIISISIIFIIYFYRAMRTHSAGYGLLVVYPIRRQMYLNVSSVGDRISDGLAVTSPVT